MHRRLVSILLLCFLAGIAVNWPELPYNARLADAIFLPLFAAVALLPWTGMRLRGPDIAVAGYVLGAIPALIVSTDQRQSAIELVRELYLAAIYITIVIATRHGFARTIGQGLALGGAVLSVTGLTFIALQFIGAPPWPSMGEVMMLPYLGNTLRLRAFTASEAMLACALTAALPFAVEAWRSRGATAWRVMTVVMILAAGFTFSHALAGLFVALLVATWPMLMNRAVRGVATAAVVAIVIGLNFAATVSIKSVSTSGSGFADTSEYHYAVDQRQAHLGGATVIYNVMSYARIKQIAWRTFTEHPIAGIGLDRFQSASMRAHQEGLLPQLYSEIDPHSTLLGRLAECGLIGGITLIVLWLSWAGLARQYFRDRVGLGMAAGAALAGLIVSSLNADIMNFRFLWVIAGLLRGLQDANGMATASGRGEAEDAGTR